MAQGQRPQAGEEGAAQVSERFVDAGGVRTRVHEGGSGSPVLLVHGSGPGVSAWANWRLTLPALAERFRVVAPDVVGFGTTERPPGVAYDRTTWTKHLLDLLDALGLERVSVVGNSFGGAMALSLAAVAPERVDRLVLMGSVGVSFPITPALERVWGFDARQATPSQTRELLELFAYDTSRITDDLVELRRREAAAPGIAEAYLQMFPAPRQDALDALATNEDELRGLSHRTLLVHGRDDRVIPLATSLRLNALLDRSDLHVFGQCGHWVQIEAHDRFARLVTDFLT